MFFFFVLKIEYAGLFRQSMKSEAKRTHHEDKQRFSQQLIDDLRLKECDAIAKHLSHKFKQGPCICACFLRACMCVCLPSCTCVCLRLSGERSTYSKHSHLLAHASTFSVADGISAKKHMALFFPEL